MYIHSRAKSMSIVSFFGMYFNENKTFLKRFYIYFLSHFEETYSDKVDSICTF